MANCINIRASEEDCCWENADCQQWQDAMRPWKGGGAVLFGSDPLCDLIDNPTATEPSKGVKRMVHLEAHGHVVREIFQEIKK